ncbi:Putative vacuolar protein sorting-associated protein [Komagataella phaffii CBS 7435]|nr:GQ68_02293T0 [Komagataella phaffii GS115]CAH2446540.1 Putative vacuolar protein sorting-associated protein [Komagataella phaffii CBS 7435]CCA36833.1 Putative vacuolar protein sorting-associated protein [Komagataella phaffii CBS 7435]
MPPIAAPGFRLKTSLKMAISRLRHLQEKKSALTKQQRRQMGDLLIQRKEESARIRVEGIIREDILVELLEYLELYCELLLARIGLINESPKCDPGLEEAVKSIIYAAPFTEVKELMTIRDITSHKYGKEFAQAALTNEDGIVPEKIVKRCSVQPPSEELIDLYLVEIAKTYNAPFSKLPRAENPESEPDLESEDEDTPNDSEKTKKTAGPVYVKKGDQDLDELKKRFEALKR